VPENAPKDAPEDTPDGVEDQHAVTYTFEVHISTNGSASVLVPITGWVLPGTVWVESGNATFEWVDIEQVEGLRIHCEGPTELRSSITTMQPIEDWARLSMEEENGTLASILYKASAPPSSNSSIRLSFNEHYSGPHAGWHYYSIHEPLVEGLDTYQVRELLLCQ
jgi:hypothetical protein